MIPLQVETITDTDGLVRIEPEWKQLLAESEIEHPFLTPEWITAWWKAFGAGRKLHVLVVREQGRAVAIAPLMTSRGRLYGLPVRRLETIANDHTPRAGFIVASGRAEAHALLWGALIRSRPGWDVLMLKQVPGDSGSLVALKTHATRDGWLEGRWRASQSPWLTIDGDFNTYLSGLSAKHRANLRNRDRRLAKVGEIELETVTGGPGLDEALAEGLKLEAAGWKGKAGTAILEAEDTERFYSEFSKTAALRGWLTLHFLKVAGKRVAFDYGLTYQKRLYLLKAAYDPTFAAYSPYTQLLQRVLSHAFEEKMLELDFLGAADRWKFDWTGTARPHEWLFLMPPSLHLRVVHAAKFWLAPRLQKHRAFERAAAALRGWAGARSDNPSQGGAA
jgi:CelD/BcsL family acetyltransferase involved in cellulose biosynthesis